LQEQASNHLKLRWLNARVVSVKEKSRHRIVAGEDQGDERKRTTDEVSKSTGEDQGDERKRTTDEVSKSSKMRSKLVALRSARISPEETCLLSGRRPA
jgi:hypothetical protein